MCLFCVFTDIYTQWDDRTIFQPHGSTCLIPGLTRILQKFWTFRRFSSDLIKLDRRTENLVCSASGDRRCRRTGNIHTMIASTPRTVGKPLFSPHKMGPINRYFNGISIYLGILFISCLLPVAFSQGMYIVIYVYKSVILRDFMLLRLTFRILRNWLILIITQR